MDGKDKEPIATSGKYLLVRYREDGCTRFAVEEDGRAVRTDEDRGGLQDFVGIHFGAMVELALAAGMLDYGGEAREEGAADDVPRTAVANDDPDIPF